MARCFLEWSTGAQEPLWDLLDKIECPVRWIVGARDVKYVEIGREAVEGCPRAELLEVASCGHRVPWEWNGFAEMVNDWAATFQG